MNQQTIYKALFKPILAFGVPMILLGAELLLAIMLVLAMNMWWSLPVILIFHLVLAHFYKRDPLFMTIRLEAAFNLPDIEQKEKYNAEV